MTGLSLRRRDTTEVGLKEDNTTNTAARKSSSSFLSFHQESYVSQIVPSQCLAQPMAMSLAVVRSWGEQAVSIMGQTSRCCMVCLMPQSQVSGSVENPHFNMLTLDRPTWVRNRLSAFQVVQRGNKIISYTGDHRQARDEEDHWKDGSIYYWNHGSRTVTNH